MKNRMIAAVAFVGITAAGAMAQELTTNGGFEAGDTSGWVSFPTPNSTFNVTGDANSGAFAAEVFNNDAASGAVVKQANIGIGQVNPGDEITVKVELAPDRRTLHLSLDVQDGIDQIRVLVASDHELN